MSDIRALFAGLGDLRSELTALGRFLLSVVDQETEMLQIATRIPAGRSARLDAALAAFVDGIKAELCDWIETWAPTLTREHCAVLAAIGIDSLLGARLAAGLFPQAGTVPDDIYLAEWTTMLATRIESLSGS